MGPQDLGTLGCVMFDTLDILAEFAEATDTRPAGEQWDDYSFRYRARCKAGTRRRWAKYAQSTKGWLKIREYEASQRRKDQRKAYLANRYRKETPEHRRARYEKAKENGYWLSATSKAKKLEYNKAYHARRRAAAKQNGTNKPRKVATEDDRKAWSRKSGAKYRAKKRAERAALAGKCTPLPLDVAASGCERARGSCPGARKRT